jgi:CheY-like chemotaxis protein
MSETRPTLLVVDDVAANIDILLEAVGEDYTVRVATDGAAALNSVKKLLPDLILLDIMMPGIDGFEVCRRLKDDPATQDIPIIFLTARNEDADEASGLSLGAVDYITKPFNPAIVNARVRNHLELKKHRDHLTLLVAQRTRELAKAYERLLELGRLKDDFLRMISHEIRTPANGVLGIGELIIDLCPASEDCTLYSDLFQKSSLRLRNLIEDATMIVDIEKAPLKSGAAISFPVLLDEVRASLKDIHISVAQQGSMEHVCLEGDHTLMKRALATTILLATAFSRDKHTAHITGVVEARIFRVHLDLDDLSLSAEQAAGFFETGSTARSASPAETLGLAPVVAHKIISAFGGELRIVKGEGTAGYLEAILTLEADRFQRG